MTSTIKLYADEKEGTFACRDGTSTLRNFSGSIRCLSVIGRCRTGKSSLINFFTGQPTACSVGNGGSVTTGADILSRTFSLSDLCSAHSYSGLRGDFPVAIIDTEGFGDRNNKYSLRLAFPLMFISSVIIYHLKGVFGKENILDELALLILAAEKLSAGKKAHAPFGRLHIVIRDWTNMGDDKSVYDMVFKEEAGNSQESNSRNERRRLILKSFASVSIHCLPTPASSADISRHSSLPVNLMSAEFKMKAGQLCKDVCHSLALSEGRTGNSLGDMLSLLVNKMNSQTLNFTDILHSASALLCTEEATNIAKKHFLPPHLPVEESLLAKCLKEQLARAVEALTRWAKDNDIASDVLKSGYAHLQQSLFRVHEASMFQLNKGELVKMAAAVSEKLKTSLKDASAFTFLPTDESTLHAAFQNVLSQELQKIEPLVRSQVSANAGRWREGFFREEWLPQNDKATLRALKHRHEVTGAIDKYRAKMTTSKGPYIPGYVRGELDRQMLRSLKLEVLSKDTRVEVEQEFQRAKDEITECHNKKLESLQAMWNENLQVFLDKLARFESLRPYIPKENKTAWTLLLVASACVVLRIAYLLICSIVFWMAGIMVVLVVALVIMAMAQDNSRGKRPSPARQPLPERYNQVPLKPPRPYYPASHHTPLYDDVLTQRFQSMKKRY